MNALYDEVRLALHAVWQRRWLALAVAWAIAIVGWTGIALIPNSYESKARVSVDMQSLLPSKVGIAAVEQQRDVDQVRQTLTSTVNLQKVVRGTDLSLYAPSDKDVAAMVDKLRDDVTLKAQQDNIFELSARVGGGGRSDATNAKLAKAVVQKLIDIFVETNLADDRDETSQTIRFLDQELARRQAALQEAEQKKVQFETQHMGLLPGVGSVADRLAQAQAELGQLESQLVSAQSSAAAMNGQLASVPPTIAVAGGAASVGGARGAIADLEGKIVAGQAEGWTDQHPDMVAMRNQIARLRPQAAREGGGGGTPGSISNPAYSSLRSLMADRQATASALTQRKAQLSAEIAGYMAKVSQSPDVQAQETQLTRDHDVLKAQYDKLVQDREDVRLQSDVSAKTDAIKFTVIDPPSDPRVPVAPKRPLLLTGILLLAIGAGVGTAFAMGKLVLSYPTADRLAAVGLPVLGSIGEVVTQAQRQLRARRLKWFAGGGGALAATFALLLAIEFIQRGLVA